MGGVGARARLQELNNVAPFITMWFLTCYSIINGACFILAFDSAPGFRPAWKYFHWSTSLAGSVICLGMMFFIYWCVSRGGLARDPQARQRRREYKA